MKIATLKGWARRLTLNTHALYLSSRDPRVPIAARLLAIFVVAYALSPIDLIPDFIPLLGYVDDLLLLPCGIWLVIHLIPEQVWQQNLLLAAEQNSRLAANRVAAAVIVLIWLCVAVWVASYCLKVLGADA